MDVQPLEYNFDIERLTTECQNVIDNIELHEYHNQISLKHTTNDLVGNVWYQGCGSLKYKFGKKLFDENGKLNTPEVKLEQSDFTELNNDLKSTYIEEVHDKVATDYRFGRMRIMAMSHKKCMSIHIDASKRIHIPLITNENCLMIIDNKVHHMPANGNAYLVDTTKPHTALNANHKFLRLHLLFDLY